MLRQTAGNSSSCRHLRERRVHEQQHGDRRSREESQQRLIQLDSPLGESARKHCEEGDHLPAPRGSHRFRREHLTQSRVYKCSASRYILSARCRPSKSRRSPEPRRAPLASVPRIEPILSLRRPSCRTIPSPTGTGLPAARIPLSCPISLASSLCSLRIPTSRGEVRRCSACCETSPESGVPTAPLARRGSVGVFRVWWRRGIVGGSTPP